MLSTRALSASKQLSRKVSVLGAVRAKHTVPDLDYDYNELEPVISAKIMQLHHDKHHATYVANLNAAEEKLQEAQAKNNVAAQVAVQPAINFNGGGHVNHSIFWKNLIGEKNGGGHLHDGALKTAIEQQYGSLDSLTKAVNGKTAGIFGSGWGWLTFNKALGHLDVIATANQDMPSSVGHVPLLGVDAWEHAYYLDYNNVKAEYFKNIWRVINWKDVAKRYDNAVAEHKASKN
ncbi:Superoxide dismutase [Mn], mitochondrial [Coemansia spiralis]|uniref:Superoxide dismutase n=2 Tax=Coemansia TaxID=4863 RepID=A0A9W8G3C3_9FUNG|nr:putative SOD2-superoxide dismutase precursor, mitochondrial [Coemansia spiralis]KAJ1988321.1 Superoxide dismutase [Mn], mitochondrial [Coemansia umbellata]KAJ2619654.1 Superoxide dismutase [Mn], mitochondrial [Coemansia sp. RSA 1358]KAJ2671788.1 Superoxide dismutase [Mn], mitochondrial [Coemansia spiralis]